MPAKVNAEILEAVAPYDHVIWDWNGTLLDDTDEAVEAVNALLSDHNLPGITAHCYRSKFGFPVRDYYHGLGFDFEKFSFEKLCERFSQEYNQKRALLAKLFTGVEDLLSQIRLAKTQSILSAAAQDHLDAITTHFGIADHFHYRYGLPDQLATSKIARGHELIAIAGVAPEKTILIGDTAHDYEVAQALGTSCLLISDGSQAHDRLVALTDKVVSGRRKY